MTTNITDSKEYKCYEKFVESPEFIKLTQGDASAFSGFDTNNSADLNKMRDYIYESVPEVRRELSFNNPTSARLSQMQIGQALIAREEYRKYEKENPTVVRNSNPTATTSRHGYVGAIKGFDGSRRVRC